MTQSITDECHGVDGFLGDRQLLIVQIMKLTASIDDRHYDIVEALLTRFCQQMIDYLSNGHFQIYTDLFPSQHQATVSKEYEVLDNSTRLAICFNDQFANGAKLSLDILRTQLDELTLALETRFELEDELIMQSKVTQMLA